MQYKAVIFDLDGTLLNTIEDIADAVNSILPEFGKPSRTIPFYRKAVGDGFEELIRRVFNIFSGEDTLISDALEKARAQYRKRCYNKTRLYNGINGMLDELTALDISINILSNKPHSFVLPMVEKYFYLWKFDVVLGARPEIPHKPAAESVEEILEKTGFQRDEYIFVGDTPVDIKTALNSGLFPAGVSWGFRGREELIQSGAGLIIDMPDDLAAFIRNSANH